MDTFFVCFTNFHQLSNVVPPRWKTEPSDVSVERNRHVTLHCQAEGVPTPTVQWKKATGKIILHDKAYHLGKLICLFAHVAN